MNTILPILGAVAIALLALAAAAVWMFRRRRRRLYEADAIAAQEAEVPVEAELSPEPAFVPAAAVAAPTPTPVHDPIFSNAPASSPTTDLPEGFDISRFGRHTQAAYRGPTPDNPSLSLRYRLRKAAALDQMERANRAEPAVESAAVKVAAARAEVAPGGHDFMLRTDGPKAVIRRAYSE